MGFKFNPLTGVFDLSPSAVQVPFDNSVTGELTALNVQDAIDELTSSIDEGTPNRFAGFDGSGNLEAIPTWERNPLGGVNIDQASPIDPGTSQTFIFSNLQGDLANDLTVFGQNYSGNIGGNFTHANYNLIGTVAGGATGINVARIDSTVTGDYYSYDSYTSPTSPTTGDFRVFGSGNDGAVLNNAAGFLYSQNGDVSKSWTGYGAYLEANAGDSNANVIAFDSAIQGHAIDGQVFGINLQLNSTVTKDINFANFNNQGNFSGNLTAFNAYTNGVQSGNFNIQGLNFNNQGTGYRFVGANISNQADMSEEIRGFSFFSNGNMRTGVGLDINIEGQATDDVHGIRVNVTNLTSTSTTNHVVGIEMNGGQLSIQGEMKPFNNTGVDIGNGLSSTITIDSGSPLTGTDLIGQLMQTNLIVNDDVATGPFGLDTNMIGFVSQIAVASGKTVPIVRSLLLGTTVPQGSGGTITEHVVIEMLGLPSFGGSVNCPTKIGIQDSQLLGQNFSDGTTDAWGIRIRDVNTQNYFGRLAINTPNFKVTNGTIGLEVDASKNTWLGPTVIGGSTFTAPTHQLEIYGSTALAGSLQVRTQITSATYTVDSGPISDHVILVDTSGGAFTITLPTPTTGRVLHFKDAEGTFSTNNLTLDPGSADIDGAAGTQAFNIDFMNIMLISDGTDWYII